MRTLKSLISMMSGFLDVPLSLKTINLYLWRSQETLTNLDNINIFSNNILRGHSKMLNIQHFEKMKQTGTEQSGRSV